jgi:methylenetetrahydrofolate dehydrogenase (NADP+)/methenyltetrahydrofolate cyclohydrolase
MGNILDCRAVARGHRERISAELAGFPFRPKLMTILATDDLGSKAYASLIAKDCASMGVLLEERRVSSKEELRAAVAVGNADEETNGIFILYPVNYPGLDDQIVMNWVHPRKDVEGLHAENLGYLVQYRRFLDAAGDYKCIVPCTPKAVVKTLRAYPDIVLEGAYVTIVNNSIPVGKALGMMLENLEATVINCHVKTDREDLETCVRMADILVTAVPGEHFVLDSALVKPGAVVVDMAYQGNIVYDELASKVRYITHPRNGIGVMTRTMLFQNLAYAAKYRGTYY